ncbi:MAG TPA: amidohydrolase family protein [Ktedonobacteraceae bacterium]|jgi:imidazolonepropionase-like amidohydrolase|nr:amidohydrolase family protein [Ktedonobacteraceae bacterium]
MAIPIALKHVTLIDGTGAAPRENVVIVLREKRIDFIGDAAQWQPQEHEQLITLNLSGRYVLPGLIDCHVHLAMDGPPDSRLQGDWAWTTLLMLKHAQNSLAAGITTVRDVGGRHGLEFSVRRSIEEGLWIGPRMQLAGKLLSITSAGTEYFDGMYREADGVDQVRKATREQFKAGADLIKVMATGAVLTPGEQPGAVQFGLDELTVAVEEARKVGKPVAAHAHALEGIRNAVAAGVRTIEHGTYLNRDERLMATMAERGIFLVPTLKAGFDIMQGDRPGIPAWIREKMKAVQEDALLSVRRAAEFGIPIAMGTDAATPYNYHGDNAMELLWMQQAGLSAMQAIVASTANAARALGWDSWLGTIEPGKVADLLVVDGNPLDNLRLLTGRHIELVFKDGQVVAGPLSELNGVPESVLAGAWICCGLPAHM